MATKKSIFQLIEKLKEINVNEVIEKSKNITIEDIKSLSWQDIKSSKFSKPLAGIGLSFLFIFIFLIPEFKKYNQKAIQSEEYSIKNQNLENLDSKLEKSKLIQSILDANLEEFTNLTVDKSKLINLTDLISDAAKRSLVEISEFSPITSEILATCAANANNSENDFLDFESEDDFNNFPEDNFDDTDEFISDDWDDSEINPLEEINKKIDYIDNNETFLNSFFLEINNDEIPKKLDDEFESNYFKIEFLGDYVNALNFLRSIQEYNILIIPKCFEPSLLSQSATQNPSQNISPPGFIRAKLMIDVPTKLKN